MTTINNRSHWSQWRSTGATGDDHDRQQEPQTTGGTPGATRTVSSSCIISLLAPVSALLSLVAPAVSVVCGGSSILCCSAVTCALVALQIFCNHAAHFTGNSLTPAIFNFPSNQFTHTSTTHFLTRSPWNGFVQLLVFLELQQIPWHFKKYTSSTSYANANVDHSRSNGSITFKILQQYHLYVFHNSLEGFVTSPAGTSIQSNTHPQLQIFCNHAAHFTRNNSLTPAIFNFPLNQFTHTSTTHFFTSPCYLEQLSDFVPAYEKQ